MKRLVYNIQIDSSDANNSIKRIEERLKELNESAESSQVEINTLTQELKDLGEATDGIDASKSTKSVDDLRGAYTKLLKELRQTEQGTERFRELAEEAGKLKNQIDDAANSVRNLSGSPFQNLNNSFRSLRQNVLTLNLPGIVRNFGDMRTSLFSLGQSFIGVQAGAGLATNGLKVFRAALIGTGVGAFVVAIGVLIANFETLKESGGVIGNTFRLLGNIFEGTTTAVLKLSDALGLTSNAYQAYINKQAESNRETKKEVGTLAELEEALFNIRKEKGKVSEEEEKAFLAKKVGVQLDKEEKELQEELNKLKNTELEIIKEIQKLEKPSAILDAVKMYEGLTDEQRKYIDNKAKELAQLREQKDILGQVAFEAKLQFDDLNNNLKFRDKEILLMNDLISVYADLSIKKRQLNDVDTTGAELNEKLNLVRKIAAEKLEEDRRKEEEKRKKALQKELDDLEKNKRIELDLINRSLLEAEITTIEAGKRREDVEQRTLSEKLRLYEKYKEDITGIQLEMSNNLVKFVEDELRETEALFNRFQSGMEESLKVRSTINQTDLNNAKTLTDAYTTLSERQKQLTSDELQRAEITLKTAEDNLEVLRQYGILEGDLYEELVFRKQKAEYDLNELKLRLQQEAFDDAQRKAQQETALKQQMYREIEFFAINSFNQIGGIMRQVYINELAMAEGNEEAKEEIRKKSFESEKALGIVSAIINTAQGVTNALASSGPPWVGIAMAAVVGALGAAEIALIASQQYVPGQTNTASPGPQGNEADGILQAANLQPAINFVGAGTGANISTAGGGTPQSIEFTGSISVSEINQVQNTISLIEGSSTLGGG